MAHAVAELTARNQQQALRMRRYLMAAGTSVLVCLILIFFAILQLVPWRAALHGSLAVAVCLAVFYLVFRTGLNLRFADPSLTTEQASTAIVVLAYIMYHAGAARPAFILFYPVAMLFGVLRLSGTRLMLLALLALAAHGTMLGLLLAREPQLDRAAVFSEFAVLFVVLPWFAVIGGYVNRLRARLSDSHRSLKEAFERIEQLAIRDELTGLYNRRFLMECLARERLRAERLNAPLCVCLIDIDRFKAINDTLGHAAGDAVLRGLAKVASAALRTIDILGRFGGEEFLLVLPGTPLAGAASAAERLRAGIAGTRFEMVGERQVTATFGVVEHLRGEEISALLARADRALYAGKAGGRNQVVLG
jgi:diguanylate cyclase (GGDEF)-like protein